MRAIEEGPYQAACSLEAPNQNPARIATAGPTEASLRACKKQKAANRY